MRHENPVRVDRQNTILNVGLGRYGFTPTRSEQLWSVRQSAGLFEITCIPFFARDISLADIVEAEEQGPEAFQVVKVVRKSGNRTLRVATEADDAEQIHSDVLSGLEVLGLAYETLDIGPQIDVKQVSDALAPYRQRLSIELT
jgi:hypothetical protein